MGQIVSRLDRVLADRKMPLKELADRVGISCVNLSKLKTGKVSGIRFSTLELICETLECQPGDIIENGYLLWADSYDRQSDEDRAAHKAMPVHAALCFAGSVECLVIQLDVTA